MPSAAIPTTVIKIKYELMKTGENVRRHSTKHLNCPEHLVYGSEFLQTILKKPQSVLWTILFNKNLSCLW